MMSKRSIIIIIIALVVILLMFAVAGSTTVNEKPHSSASVLDENEVTEIDDYNFEDIDSIYYVDPDYNPRFPEE